MIVSKMYLEWRIEEISCWLDHHHKQHYLHKLKEQNLSYYARRLAEADELELEHIKI